MKQSIIIEKPVITLASKNDYGKSTITLSIYMDDIKCLKRGDVLSPQIPNDDKLVNATQQTLECVYTSKEGTACIYRLYRVELDKDKVPRAVDYDEPELIWFEFGNKKEY